MNIKTQRPRKISRRRVTALLDQLTAAELVRVLGENEYIFKHALVQDTAYQSLLRNERRWLHHAIGDTLEKTHKGHANEYAAELAHHYAEAGDEEKTLVYAARAGDDAARVFAYPEATGFYELALNVVGQRLDSVERRRRFVDLTVKLVAVSLRTHGPAKSIERLCRAEDQLNGLQTEVQDRERLARVLFWMGDAYSHQNQQEQAVAYLQQVLQVAQDGINDETLLAIPLNVIGRALVAQGKYAQAEPLLAQAAPLLEMSANWYEWVLSVCFLGFARAAQGDTTAGLVETRRAIARAHELGTPIGISDSHILSSFIYHQCGAYNQMLEHSSAALKSARQMNDHLLTYVALNVRAWAYTLRGDFVFAEQDFQAGRSLAAHMGGQLFFTDLFYAAYAELALAQGNLPEAIARAQRTIELAQVVGSIFSTALAHRVWGQALALTAREIALEHFEQSLKLFREGNAQIEATRTENLITLFENGPVGAPVAA